MEQALEELFKDVEIEAASRNEELVLALLDRLIEGKPDKEEIKRRILGSFPPTCRAQRTRRRLNRLRRYMYNLRIAQEDAEHGDYPGDYEEWMDAIIRRKRNTKRAIAKYEAMPEVSKCYECFSCITLVDTLPVWIKSFLPIKVAEKTNNQIEEMKRLTEEFFNLL